jgi:hypothetical protein
MDDLERDARRHITKVEQTCEYLRSNRLSDPALLERKKEFIRRDVEAMEFLLEYAKEALVSRGIRV